MRLVRPIALFAILAIGAAAAHAQSATPPASTLKPGDHLKITVMGEEKNLSGEFEVGPNGTLKHPLYNEIQVVGVPTAVLKDRFAAYLRRFQREPRFEVEPLFKITVNGEVRSPSIYLLPPETTIADAIARAGGPTDRGNTAATTLFRQGEAVAVDLQRTSQDRLTIQSGDQINVPTQRSVTTSLSPLLGVAVPVLSALILLLRH